MNTTECDKLVAVSEKSNAIGDFMDWLASEKGLQLARLHHHEDECRDEEDGYYRCGFKEGRLEPTFGVTITDLLAEYYDIDLDKVEDERRALIENLQAMAAKET